MRHLWHLWPFARRERQTRRALGALLTAVFLLHVHNANAEASAEDKAKARAAYDRAAEASERGDLSLAAKELALADELAPNQVTLKAALEAALDADAAALGMELAARADARKETGPTAELAAKAKERFKGRVGRVKIVCPEPEGCEAKLDGAPIRVAEERFVLAGKHVASVVFRGRSEERTIDVNPGALALVDVVDRFGESRAHATSSGLSPLWFTLGLVGTAAAGVGVVVSGVDTKEKHEAFVAEGCDQPRPNLGCTALSDDGRSAQLRTNLLVGATAVLGAATAALGYFTFGKKNPSSGPASGVSVEARSGGGFARLVIVLP